MPKALKFNEDSVEQLSISYFQKLGYTYVYGPDIAPDGKRAERASFEDVLLVTRLQKAVKKINPTIPPESQAEAIKQVLRINSSELVQNNETFHKLLTEGVPVTYLKNGEQRGDLVWLVDFEHPERNEFVVSNQFTIIERGNNKRPDVILFVNGMPFVVIELKNPVDENATVKSAYDQLQTYKQIIPSLFTFNEILIISDGLDARAGSLSADFSRFMAWNTQDGKQEAATTDIKLQTLIRGMLNKETLLDLIRHFIVFESVTKVDAKSGLNYLSTIKILAAYHQYYAVNKAVVSTLRASGYDRQNQIETDEYLGSMVSVPPEEYGLASVQKQPRGDRKGGVIWHTQGSGKSLTMVFFTGKIVLKMDNPTVVIINDRNDLDDQLFDTFASSVQLLRQEPKQVSSCADLKEKLKVASGGVIFSTIQKFSPDDGNVYETLSQRENIIVIADEAHRTQYGFKAKNIKVRDDNGEEIGSKVVYGFAKYMRDALPNATYLGFTGTPIESIDANTPAVFGNYIDVYDIAQAVKDGATVPIYYESRLAKVNLSEEGKKLIRDLDDTLDPSELNENQKEKTRWTQLEALIGSKNRIKNIAKDIVSHFEQRQEVFAGKSMIVAMSRRIAAELYTAIIELRPEWDSSDLSKGAIKVVMTSSSSDGPEINRHHTTKDQRKQLAERMKDPNDPLKIVIVRDMWLTGFDVPCLNTLYIDKPMKGHNLMQAIARVNRVFNDKPAGLIVDYLGIASDLKQALAFYSDSGGKGDPAVAQHQAVDLMLEKLEVVSQMYQGFAYEQYFGADTATKLSLILGAEEHILGLEDGKKRYVNEVTALSKAYAIAIPDEQALDVKDEVGFFQAVKARLSKFDKTNTGNTDVEIDTTIRQVIDQALVSDKVVDIFDAAGIKKPDISILSDDFLMELTGMEHKNIALEVLKKVLNDEIQARTKTNMVQSRTFMEMLEDSIQRYHNKVITAAEVMDELIKLSKDIVATDAEATNLGLTEYEYAFYSAVADNDSARELMQKDKLRELAVVLTQRVKANASIDWTIKESVRAKLKVIIKRTLRKYGYPPDMQKLATETVLKQAEMIAQEMVGK
ncbi:MAG: DEAD/DEAH box helicase [Treponema sp. CETP13]|nr:MAG: DEAD/DEAH box helicase [Treponema sp. CETP13]